jgi:hypothetical protein
MQIMGWRADLVSTLLIAALIVGDYWFLRSGAIELALLVQAIIGGSVVAILGIFWWNWGDRITRFLKGSNKTKDQSQKEELEKLLNFESREAYYSMPNKPRGTQGFHGPPVEFQDAVQGGSFTMRGGFEDIDKIQEARQKIHSGEIDQNELEKLIKPLYIAFDKYKDWTPIDWEMNINIFGSRYPSAKEALQYKGLPLAFSILYKPGRNAEYLKSLGEDKVDSVIGILQLYGDLAQPQLRELVKQYFEVRQNSEKSEEKFWSDSNFINIYGIFNRMGALIKKRYDELMWVKKES